jgi:hypothetical protein
MIQNLRKFYAAHKTQTEKISKSFSKLGKRKENSKKNPENKERDKFCNERMDSKFWTLKEKEFAHRHKVTSWLCGL